MSGMLIAASSGSLGPRQRPARNTTTSTSTPAPPPRMRTTRPSPRLHVGELLVPADRLLELVAAVGHGELVEAPFPRGRARERVLEVHGPLDHQRQRARGVVDRVERAAADVHANRERDE